MIRRVCIIDVSKSVFKIQKAPTKCSDCNGFSKKMFQVEFDSTVKRLQRILYKFQKTYILEQ